MNLCVMNDYLGNVQIDPKKWLKKYILNMIKVNQTCTYKLAKNREKKYSEMNLSENKKNYLKNQKF